jgi:hypothetical protein
VVLPIGPTVHRYIKSVDNSNDDISVTMFSTQQEFAIISTESQYIENIDAIRASAVHMSVGPVFISAFMT